MAEHPKIITHNYIEPSDIKEISKFRSATGHDYADDFEECRSMKHYFKPNSNSPNPTIYAPVSGKIINIEKEGRENSGSQIGMAPKEFPNYSISIFHIVPKTGLEKGSRIYAGEVIGHHVGLDNMSDIAVRYLEPGDQKSQLVSYFELLSDYPADEWLLHGIAPENMGISKKDRDKYPLECVAKHRAYKNIEQNNINRNKFENYTQTQRLDKILGNIDFERYDEFIGFSPTPRDLFYQSQKYSD
jgi:hypothetical protein